LNVELTESARNDLRAIKNHIAQSSPTHAERVIATILNTISIFENFPLIGRPGSKPNTHEFSVSRLPYYIVYDIPNPTTVRVLAIMHDKRQYP